jgi:glycerophosphoryl diester phosphodiesterase
MKEALSIILKEMPWLITQPYAHRGLHDAARQTPENALPAFQLAIDAGHGIQLDTQMTADGAIAVFHDDTLDRMTEASGDILEWDWRRLSELALAGTEHRIPLLEQVLEQVNGQVPLLIDAKAPYEAQIPRYCLTLRRALEGYRGPVAVMSADQTIIRWFLDNAPKIPRGLVVSEEGRTLPLLERLGIRRRLSLWQTKPHFLAYDVRSLPSPFATRANEEGLPILTWTVDSAERFYTAREFADGMIYEPFDLDDAASDPAASQAA